MHLAIGAKRVFVMMALFTEQRRAKAGPAQPGGGPGDDPYGGRGVRAVPSSGREHPVLCHRGCAVVPVQDPPEADQSAVEGGVDALGEDEVEHGSGGLG